MTDLRRPDPALSTSVGQRMQARLRDLARNARSDAETVLMRYSHEGLLRRLFSHAPDHFALRGGALMVLAEECAAIDARATRDIDLDACFEGTVEEAVALIRAAAAVTPDTDDSVRIELDTIQITVSKDGKDGRLPGGFLSAWIQVGMARLRLNIDVVFGKRPPCGYVERTLPSVDSKAPGVVVRCIPLEAMVADKVHALARHGATNSRIRDYYDLWIAAGRDLDWDVVRTCAAHTFALYGTEVPSGAEDLDALDDKFAVRNTRVWDDYRSHSLLSRFPPDLAEVVEVIRQVVSLALPDPAPASVFARSP